MSYSWQLSCAANAAVQGYSRRNRPDLNDLREPEPITSPRYSSTKETPWEPRTAQARSKLALRPNRAFRITSTRMDQFPSPSRTVAITSPAAKLGSRHRRTAHRVHHRHGHPLRSLPFAHLRRQRQRSHRPHGNRHGQAAGSNVYHASYADIHWQSWSTQPHRHRRSIPKQRVTTTSALNVVTANAAPVLQTLTPPSATHGGAALQVTIGGTGFISGCYGTFNGAQRKTTFVSSTQIKDDGFIDGHHQCGNARRSPP